MACKCDIFVSWFAIAFFFLASEGTAIAGTHYVFESPLTVTFDYNATEAAVPIRINNTDSVYTGHRTITLQLQNPVGGPIVDGQDILEITIVDNGMVHSRQSFLETHFILHNFSCHFPINYFKLCNVLRHRHGGVNSGCP